MFSLYGKLYFWNKATNVDCWEDQYIFRTLCTSSVDLFLIHLCIYVNILTLKSLKRRFEYSIKKLGTWAQLFNNY